jgi:hypothetical protein
VTLSTLTSWGEKGSSFLLRRYPRYLSDSRKVVRQPGLTACVTRACVEGQGDPRVVPPEQAVGLPRCGVQGTRVLLFLGRADFEPTFDFGCNRPSALPQVSNCQSVASLRPVLTRW